MFRSPIYKNIIIFINKTNLFSFYIFPISRKRFLRSHLSTTKINFYIHINIIIFSNLMLSIDISLISSISFG